MNTRNATVACKEAKYERMTDGGLVVTNAAILWTNFAGAPDKFNPQGGKRSFNLVLPEEVATSLREEGWNIKCRLPREEGDEATYYTEIVINTNSYYPPMIKLKTILNGKANLVDVSEEELAEFDHRNLTNICCKISAYKHGRAVSSGTTIKGYCNEFYATEEFQTSFSDYDMPEYESPMHRGLDDEDVPWD